jgi:endonuclease/exonuclease/phosphatase family metal-dependent hydrolase
MTRNLYLGAELTGIVAAIGSGDPARIVAAATQTWNQVVASDPAERMAAVADEIAATGPQAVGLQEVTRYTTYDYDPTVPPTQGFTNPTVTYDLLDLLLEALAQRGEQYRVVAGATAQNFSSPPVPYLTGGAVPSKAVQLLDRDVIIVRDDVTATNARNGNFVNVLKPPAFPIRVDRGWGSADLRTRLATFRFVNSHTEAFGEESVRVAEVGELFAAQDAITEQSGALPTVYAGDFNSDAPPMGSAEGVEGEGGYEALLDGGLTDLWRQARPSATDAESDTCCQDADLGNEVPELSSRIDLLLGTDGVRASSADRVGDEPVDLPGDTWWASDHAGVVADVVIPGR